MKTVTQRMGDLHNMGLLDRVLRAIIGGAMVGIGAFSIYLTGNPTWEPFLMLVAIYPLTTSIVGVCPLYYALGARSCSTASTGRNQCGTFPYEVDAALGRNPIPDKEYDHSLVAAHHEKKKFA